MALRPLRESDLRQILEWRNSEEVRAGMYSSHEIGIEEHEAWYGRISNESDSRWYVHISESGSADGVVYFTEIDEPRKNSNWGFYTAPGAMPGTGTQLGIEALDAAFYEQGFHRLNAEVLATNSRSAAFHRKLGFTEEGLARDLHFDGDRYVDVLRFGMLASDWPEYRERLVGRRMESGRKERPMSERSGKSERYIVASSKRWHRSGYEELQAETGQWSWASTPEELDNLLERAAPRYIFFLHWNWLVPPRVLSASECVCFHMTDLPYGRGGSPLQNLILAGHTETKLSALRMIEEMDAGPVYAKRELSLEGRAEEIYKRAGTESVEIIKWMIREEPEPVPQEGAVTTFLRRNPQQSILPKTASLEELYDFIRMLDAPTYPLGFIRYGNFNLEFSHALPREGAIEARVCIRSLDSEDNEET